jgi:hypothetical protein
MQSSAAVTLAARLVRLRAEKLAIAALERVQVHDRESTADTADILAPRKVLPQIERARRLATASDLQGRGSLGGSAVAKRPPSRPDWLRCWRTHPTFNSSCLLCLRLELLELYKHPGAGLCLIGEFGSADCSLPSRWWGRASASTPNRCLSSGSRAVSSGQRWSPLSALWGLDELSVWQTSGMGLWMRLICFRVPAVPGSPL